MNSTLYWDHLETTHGPLACNPNGGDPEYAFVCWYTLEFVASCFIVIAAWLFLSAYRKVRLDKLMHATQGQDQIKRPHELSHFVQFALITGTAVLLGGLGLFVNGAGTKYGLDEFRGQLGDTFCKSDLVRHATRAFCLAGVAQSKTVVAEEECGSNKQW
jgi:hypothetical protein